MERSGRGVGYRARRALGGGARRARSGSTHRPHRIMSSTRKMRPFYAVVLLTPMLQACGSPTAPPAAGIAEELLFASDRTGVFQIYRLEEEGPVQLTDDSTYDSWWPRASPDGSTIVLYRTAVSDRPEVGGANSNYAAASLWSMRADGSGLRELIARGSYGWEAQGVADWSPDGRRLVMAAASAAEDGRWYLFVTDAAGRNPLRVSRRSSLFLDPSWSPDGRQLVYSAFPEGYEGQDIARTEIHVSDADGGNEQRLTSDGFRDHDPYWAPDGSEIAFETDVDPEYRGVGRWALRAVRPDGTGLRTVLDDGSINTVPRWSGDSSRFYFHRLEFGSGRKFFLARVEKDGTGLVRLTDGGAYDDTDVDPLPLP